MDGNFPTPCIISGSLLSAKRLVDLVPVEEIALSKAPWKCKHDVFRPSPRPNSPHTCGTMHCSVLPFNAIAQKVRIRSGLHDQGQVWVGHRNKLRAES
jgi:hypothetical protein